MIKADLQIHSIYSSHALYMPFKSRMEYLKRRFPEKAFWEGKVWWVEHIAIDGITPPEKILKLAALRGLKAVAITDHNTTLGSIHADRLSKKYGVVVIPAMEVSTSEGELLVYGIKEKLPFRIDPYMAIKKVRNQGGVIAIPHPFLKPHPKKDFATMSREMILNLHPDALDVFSPIFGFQKYWSEFAYKHGFSEIGTSDAHMDALIGTVWTEFPDECKSVSDFLEAIKYRKTKAGGISNRKPIIARSVCEFLWSNTFGRPFIPFN